MLRCLENDIIDCKDVLWRLWLLSEAFGSTDGEHFMNAENIGDFHAMAGYSKDSRGSAVNS